MRTARVGLDELEHYVGFLSRRLCLIPLYNRLRFPTWITIEPYGRLLDSFTSMQVGDGTSAQVEIHADIQESRGKPLQQIFKLG
jgi:hypothetical protein